MTTRTLLLPLLLSFCFHARATDRPLFSSEWGSIFERVVTDQGDTLSVGGIYADGSRITLYDLVRNRLIILDTLGNFLDSVHLAPSGRAYAGDDFVIRGNECIFLNSTDKRLAFFDLDDGRLLRTLPLPSDPFPEESSRIRKVLSRVFLDGSRLFVGNDFNVVAIDEGLGKYLPAGRVKRAPRGERFVLYRSDSSIVVKNGSLRDQRGRTWKDLPPRYQVWGKRYAKVNDALVVVRFDANGVAVVRLPRS